MGGAEFLGMIMLIVYVGAVAVLFLFVVMMLNVAQQENEWFQSKKGNAQSSSHIPFGFLISTIIFFELIIVIGGWKYKPDIGNSLNLNLNEGITSTDLVLHITKLLRANKVVGSFIEFFGDGVENLTVGDRATISNMAPEYGATNVLFPVDNSTIEYLKMTGRTDEEISIVEDYSKKQNFVPRQ